MAEWSSVIANEFIRRAAAEERALTQMQIQKLVYIANGWNLAINGSPLTADEPQAWDYGPVYRYLWNALRSYGRTKVTETIKNSDFVPGMFADEPDEEPNANITEEERAVIGRVFRDYGHFEAFRLSALTHRDSTPWTEVYRDGQGRFDEIPSQLIRDHFVQLAQERRAQAHA